LVICDPYILSVHGDDEASYIDVLLTILPSTLSNLVFVYSKKININIIKAIEEKLPTINILSLPLEKLHDRVWIINSSRAFTTGTSLNSIGNKLSFINDLSDEDFNSFWDFLTQQFGSNFSIPVKRL
jgi:hypothetical protein